MSEACMACGGPAGGRGRAVKAWVVGGGGRWRRGRACEGCWSRRLLGSLLYQADVCKRTPCRCGWCAEWRELVAALREGDA